MIALDGAIVADAGPAPTFCHAHGCAPERAVATAVASDDLVSFRAPLCAEHVVDLLATGLYRDVRQAVDR